MENRVNGLDSSIVAFALDPTTEEHPKARDSILSMREWAMNPTVVHEVYHTLVFKRSLSPLDAKTKLGALVKDGRTRFLSLTKATSLYSMAVALEFNLGGRDSLILGCYLMGGIKEMFTHDKALLGMKQLAFRGREIVLTDPLAGS